MYQDIMYVLINKNIFYVLFGYIPNVNRSSLSKYEVKWKWYNSS